MTTITYPHTPRGDIVERHFERNVADPYRWLENDVRIDTDVARWVQAQNQVTRAYLDALPAREIFKTRLTALFDHERVMPPFKRGNRYFHTRNTGLENQDALYVREGVAGPDRVLINPNLWSDDGAMALSEWSASEDGAYVAFAVQDGGTDWRTIKVFDVNAGDVRHDEVHWARFTGISWARDGSGFFYARYPEPEQGAAHQAGLADHAVYFHALGTHQSQDKRLYATPDQPHLLHFAGVTDDGRYAVISSTAGGMNNALTVIDLTDPHWTPRKVIDTIDDEWSMIGNVGTTFFVMTTQGAERRRVVTIDLDASGRGASELVPEQSAVLSNAWLLGGRLLASYLADAKTDIRRYMLDGTPDGTVALPGIGTAGAFRGQPDDPESFFVFTSFNAPTTIYRYHIADDTRTVWAEPNVDVDLDAINVEQHFFTSQDGTRVPMFIVRRRDVTGPVPTMLYAYGGFGINIIPVYSPVQLAWLEQGGALAVANIRGGGEYGRAWHEAGRRDRKQNVFDDFIAAATYLHAEGITSPEGLAIQGQSNGGLLVGAVVNQRPDLFAAALPGVGVMDMLRFNQFTGGQLWAHEFGDPAEEASFHTLQAYSPYHNIQAGRRYPAILATTADTDDRVVPGHTFKYIAAIQAADLGEAPHLVRVETRAGHGGGKPTDKVIDEYADMWAFAAQATGLRVAPITSSTRPRSSACAHRLAGR